MTVQRRFPLVDFGLGVLGFGLLLQRPYDLAKLVFSPGL